MSDSLVFSESISSDLNVSEFTKKKWVYAIDSQNGSYNNQVTIDTTTISNSGAFPNWAEGFIVMPLVVTLTTSTLAAAANLPVGKCSTQCLFLIIRAILFKKHHF
jgi:hypothetical protein